MKELETQLFSRPEFKDNRKLEELRAENDKLNYRANILVRVSGINWRNDHSKASDLEYRRIEKAATISGSQAR